MQFALCHGAVDLIGIRAGDKDVAFTSTTKTNADGSENYLEVKVDQPSLFGGDEKEGGLAGTIDFYRGVGTQASDSYLSGVQGRRAPAYKNLSFAIFRQFYVGTSSYIKSISFIVRRLPNPFGYAASGATAYHDINGDANPALMVYELLTSKRFGRGRPPSRIAQSSFDAAAKTLKAEGLGLSIQLDGQSSANQIIDDLCRHMDGVLYVDPSTGLYTLKLARADYDPAAIPTLTVDSIIGSPDFSRGSWSETVNEIKIRFVDRNAGFKERVSVPAQDLANITVTGELRSDTIDFRGISNQTTATLVAARVLKTCSYPLSKLKLSANRSAWSYRPGSVFRFTWEPLGISNQIFRVARISYGNLQDGKIGIEAVEDIFGLSKVAFTAPPSSGWIEPVGSPQTPAAQKLVELPYFFAKDGIRVAAFVVRGDQTSSSHEIWTDEGSGYFLANEVPTFCPSGLLAADLPISTPAKDTPSTPLQITIAAAGAIDLARIEDASDADVLNGTQLVLLDDEILAWKSKTYNADGSVTLAGVWRGVLDTVPAAHSAGSRVWFFTEGSDTVKQEPYPSDRTVTAKIVCRNSRGQTSLSAASAITVATGSRAAKPCPPGRVRVNGDDWPNGKTYPALTDAVLSWAPRVRTATSIVAQDADGSGVTPEGNYKVELLANGSVKRTATGVTGTSWTYTLAMAAADGITSATPLSFRITPTNGSLSGVARTTQTFFLTVGS